MIHFVSRCYTERRHKVLSVGVSVCAVAEFFGGTRVCAGFAIEMNGVCKGAASIWNVYEIIFNKNFALIVFYGWSRSETSVAGLLKEGCVVL